MNNQIISKITIVLISILIIALLSPNIVFGKINTDVEIGNKYINEAEPIGNSIVGAIKIIGIFVFVGMTMVIGIKYMVTSVEQRAEYKKTAILYLAGAILIFATTQIIGLISKIIN